MAMLTETSDLTVADLFEFFGPIPLKRIRHDPAPGTATEEDVIAIHAHEKRLYELIDGILVEKTVGMQESYLAVLISSLLFNYVQSHGLGIVLGADGMARLFSGRIRIPDVSFISWDRLPDRKVPNEAFVNVGLDFVVEVLSSSNTDKEMNDKLKDYFQAGVRLVWYVDPAKETVQVFESLTSVETLRKGQILDGGTVLPGFTLAVDTIFSDLVK